MDEIVRILFLALGVTALLVWVVGGLLTRVGGTWSDGDRRIVLRQRGPILRGHAARPGGGEIYRGTAWLGRVWLKRTDHGLEHLEALGFDRSMAPLVPGHVTAYLRLRLSGDELRGTFEGVRFRFSEGRPRKILARERTAPTPRTWRRAPPDESRTSSTSIERRVLS